MRSNRIQSRSNIVELERERQAQHEIETFLKALSSYPASFAHDPDLSFEQFLVTLTTNNQRPHMA